MLGLEKEVQELDRVILDLQNCKVGLRTRQMNVWRELVEEEDKRERDGRMCEREIEDYLRWKKECERCAIRILQFLKFSKLKCLLLPRPVGASSSGSSSGSGSSSSSSSNWSLKTQPSVVDPRRIWRKVKHRFFSNCQIARIKKFHSILVIDNCSGLVVVVGAVEQVVEERLVVEVELEEDGVDMEIAIAILICSLHGPMYSTTFNFLLLKLYLSIVCTLYILQLVK